MTEEALSKFLSILLLVHPPGQAQNLMKKGWPVCELQPRKISRFYKLFRQTIEIYAAVLAIFSDPWACQKIALANQAAAIAHC